MKSKKELEYLEYRKTFVQPYPRYTIKKIGGKRWRTIKGTLPDAQVKGHLGQDHIIGVLAKWYPGHTGFDIDDVPLKAVEKIRERLGVNEDNSMLFSSESSNSYHLFLKPTYKSKPPTERLLQDILIPFGKQNDIEIYPQANRTFRLPFGYKQKCLDSGYEHLETWQEYLYWFNKLDDFDISTVPGQQLEFGLIIPGEKTGISQIGRELLEIGLVNHNSRHDSQFKVLYYLWRRNIPPETAIGICFNWIKNKHNGYSIEVKAGNWNLIYQEIKRQAISIYNNYEMANIYPDETHNSFSGYLTIPDLKDIIRISKGNLPRMNFLYSLVKYCYPRRYRTFIDIHSDKLIEWSSKENYQRNLEELSNQGIIKRGNKYSVDRFSKSIKINWNFKDSKEAILYDSRAPDTLEDTIKLSYDPEEFKELLKEAGSKRTTAIETVKRLYEGVKKQET